MNICIFSYEKSWRDLKRIISAILKNWLASKIEKLNYCQSFSLNDNKIEKKEIKILLIHTEEKEKLCQFISKTFSDLKEILL